MPDKFQPESPLDRLFNRFMGRLLRLGIAPGYMRLLEVRGRKSGKLFTTPVNLLEFHGRLILVAARGETAWARNARAAGRVTLRRGSTAQSLRVRELPDTDKPEIIKAFLDRFASQVQRFFDVKAGSPPDAFRAVSARTPGIMMGGLEIPSVTGLFFQFDRKPKGGSFARLAMHAHFALHQ